MWQVWPELSGSQVTEEREVFLALSYHLYFFGISYGIRVCRTKLNNVFIEIFCFSELLEETVSQEKHPEDKIILSIGVIYSYYTEIFDRYQYRIL